MTNTDIVVVLPGIMGSTLTKDDLPVWGPSAGAVLHALRTLGRSLKDLRLPAGIGDAHPGDGVQAVDLMPDLHIIPGIWTPMQGYDGLCKRLSKLERDGKIGRVRRFPYDWRLSNRYNAEYLASTINDELEQWRASRPDRANAQLVFVCHSMGGLIGRWYIEKCGGAEVTRKLITLGTPYRGAARAAEQLVNGVRKGLGRLSVDLTDFAHSLPSLHQLLPDYACVDDLGTLHRLDEIVVPEIATTMLVDGLTFHRDLTAAEAARPASLDMTHAIVGTRQPTTTSIRFAGNDAIPLDTIGDSNDYGDATVPLTGAIGHDLPMGTNRIRRIVDRHGNLQNNKSALDEVEGVITTEDVRRRDGDTTPIRVTAPELLLPGEPITVAVDIEPAGGPVPAVQLELIPEHVPEKKPQALEVRTPRIRAGHAETTFSPPHPGAYQIHVKGITPASPIVPIITATLVWAPE